LLSGEAALRAGAGKLMTFTGAEWAITSGVALPESAVGAVALRNDGELDALSAEQVEMLRQANAVLVGPGMATGMSPASEQVARAGRVVVADAGSLHADALAPAANKLVITPHIAEMADLVGMRPEEVARHPADVAAEAAVEFSAVVVLKGPTTWVATPDGTLWVHHVDAPGLGVSGSGDVLAGLLTGFLARGATLPQAAVWAVAVHARAGLMAARSIGRLGFLAQELLPRLPRVIDRLT
jgi:hydroxyethylthiazole kinase-like uncharacterized protein yjeF